MKLPSEEIMKPGKRAQYHYIILVRNKALKTVRWTVLHYSHHSSPNSGPCSMGRNTILGEREGN
jgi:hypothetical protein